MVIKALISLARLNELYNLYSLSIFSVYLFRHPYLERTIRLLRESFTSLFPYYLVLINYLETGVLKIKAPTPWPDE